MITHIHSAPILVADQDAALDFYVNKLGWEKRIDNMMGPEDRFLTVAPVGASTELALSTAAMMGESAVTTSGITLIVEDIDATYETLVARGVEFVDPVADQPWGARGASFKDPDGNFFFMSTE